MPLPLPRSLRARMLLSVLLPALVFVGAIVGLGTFAARSSLEDEIGMRLRDTAATAAVSLPTGLVARFSPDKARTHQNLLGRLQRVAEVSGARRVFLVAPDGRSIADTAADAPAPGEPDRELAQDRYELDRVAKGETAASVLYTGLDGVRYKRGYAPVVHEGAVVAVLGVEGPAANYAALDALQRYLVALGALALLALAALVILFSRALTAPLDRLAAASARIGAGDLDAPIAVRGGAVEIGQLARTMDEMRDALLRREREMQLMLGGIAHEVRNPLGGMKLFVGLLGEDLADRPDEAEMLGRIERELNTLERVVEEFLAYARQSPLDVGPVPLGALCVELSGLVGIAVDGPSDDTRPVQGDREQLRRLLLNLARNAQQAGATTLTVARTADGFTVSDDGPGLPPEVAERAFEAFFTTREKGTGLGLALCRKLVEAHGGRIALAPSDAGARFEISLPG